MIAYKAHSSFVHITNLIFLDVRLICIDKLNITLIFFPILGTSSANPKKIDNDFIPVSDSQLEHQKIEHDKTQIQLQPKIHHPSLYM